MDRSCSPVGTGSFGGVEAKEAGAQTVGGSTVFAGVLGALPCTALVACTVVLALGPEAVGITVAANSSVLLDLVGVLLREEFPLPFLEPFKHHFLFPFPHHVGPRLALSVGKCAHSKYCDSYL